MRGSLVVINLVPNPKSFLQRRMLEAVNEDENHLLGIMVKDGRLPHKNASRVTERAQNYLMLMLKFDDLLPAIQMWRSLPTWNPLAQTVIVFMDPIDTTDEMNKLVRKVFELLLEYGIIYANAVYQMKDDPNKMEAMTWFPFKDECCASSVDSIYKIDECIVSENLNEKTGEVTKSKKFVEFNAHLYPKIPNTLHGCPMRVSTFIWEPFVVGNDTWVESGVEILMLKTITSQMDMKLKFNILKDDVVSAKISADNETGIYADLIQK